MAERYAETRTERTEKEARDFDRAFRALALSLNACGRIDFDRMEASSGMRAQEMAEVLSRAGLIFQDAASYLQDPHPLTGWQMRSQFLSGNLLRRLEENRKAARLTRQPSFRRNTDLLEKILEEGRNPRGVFIALGASWVPASYYEEFITDLLDIQWYRPRVTWIREPVGRWKIECPERSGVACRSTYGVPGMDAVVLLDHIMNTTPIKVTREGPGGKRVPDPAGTSAAQFKADMINSAFRRWLKDHPETEESLQELYCSSFAYARLDYDAACLTFPDLAEGVVLYPHQRRAVERILLQKTTLIAHGVGTGKTYVLTVACHERKRMGLSGKNLVVVPNNMLSEAVRIHRALYPGDSLLVVSPSVFTPARRAKTLAAMQEGDYTAIYTCYSCFDRIGISPRWHRSEKKREIAEARTALNRASVPEKQAIRTRIRQLEKELKKLEEKKQEAAGPCFDELGIEALYVDEAHNYKNISVKGSMEVVGLSRSGSARSDLLLKKVRFLEDRSGCVVFSTGTPLTNSLADLFVLQTYLQPAELSYLHISEFPHWVRTFAEEQQVLEIDVDARSIRSRTRFTAFHNIRQLMGLFSQVCDYYEPRGTDLSLPAFDGYEDISVPATSLQKRYISRLTRRTEAVRAGRVKRKDDNLLRITVDGRKCALDISMVEDESFFRAMAMGEMNPFAYAMDRISSPRAAACAARVLSVYRDHPGMAQLIFCDLSTPGKGGFSLYEKMKDLLTEGGIPADEIAFIHDAHTERQKDALLARLDRGEIRVMIGSTIKLGTGVNVQTRLIAIHHLDVPWKPSDMEQRLGRLVRQGNENPRVMAYRYVTEGTFDSYSYQLLENKQRFIAQFLAGMLDAEVMDSEDIAETVLSYAEIKALCTGDPRIRKRIRMASDLDRLRMAARSRRQELEALRRRIEDAPGLILACQRDQISLMTDMEWYAASRRQAGRAAREAFGAALLKALDSGVLREEEKHIADYQGFSVIRPAYMEPDRRFVYLEREGGARRRVSMDTSSVIGVCMRLDNRLEGLPRDLEALQRREADLRRQLEAARKELEKGNPREREALKTAEALAALDRELGIES